MVVTKESCLVSLKNDACRSIFCLVEMEGGERSLFKYLIYELFQFACSNIINVFSQDISTAYPCIAFDVSIGLGILRKSDTCRDCMSNKDDDKYVEIFT